MIQFAVLFIVFVVFYLIGKHCMTIENDIVFILGVGIVSGLVSALILKLIGKTGNRKSND